MLLIDLKHFVCERKACEKRSSSDYGLFPTVVLVVYFA